MSVTSAERFALWSPTEESHLHRRQPFLCRAGLIALMSVTSAERFALWSPTEESHLHRRQPFLWSGDLARVPDQPTMSFLARSRVARPQEHAAAVRVS